MRRFSQRNSLVTLSEINITPLLDLAFVLLIIFVITTPVLEQGMQMKLPVGGKPDQQINSRNIRTVEINDHGYMLGKVPMSLNQIETELVKIHQNNTNLFVYIRADRNTPWEKVFTVVDRLTTCGLRKVVFRSEPLERHR
ncbi:MAG TPA: biopolymer transporter ExbD [Candidatus Paceibacterota bacterium]|nr:biopolymer transporter ExbD [Verrucomicrobiota bacterium]HRY48225.1 biopolymer transporter ExbD [Candidatus Paceibacterota bacterium]